MNRLISSLFIAIAAAMLLSGCAGYQLGSVKPSVYAGIDKLHVPPFKNDTLEPRISSLVTNAVLKEIQADGTYAVSNRSNCDAVLVGRITEIKKYQLRAARTDTLESRELKLRLYVYFYLEDPVTGERIYTTLDDTESSKDKGIDSDPALKAKQGRVYGSTIQFVDPSYQVGERSAISVAAEDLAKKLVSHIANGW
tara:strand:- start:316 stop:903 length:588 start_codon:yes stop_codon:yes gene_type:complete